MLSLSVFRPDHYRVFTRTLTRIGSLSSPPQKVRRQGFELSLIFSPRMQLVCQEVTGCPVQPRRHPSLPCLSLAQIEKVHSSISIPEFFSTDSFLKDLDRIAFKRIFLVHPYTLGRPRCRLRCFSFPSTSISPSTVMVTCSSNPVYYASSALPLDFRAAIVLRPPFLALS